MPSFWSNRFTKICLEMGAAGNKTKWLSVAQEAVSLHALLANNKYTETNIGRDKWKSHLHGSSFQKHCNMEGFNVILPSGTNAHAMTRIGIISNNENDCHSCNSKIGFGSAGNRGEQHGTNSCGNEAGSQGTDKGEKHIEAHCYILVQ